MFKVVLNDSMIIGVIIEAVWHIIASVNLITIALDNGLPPNRY